ncbi:HAMP domain-containing sensor histidine kinase [Hyphococcus flavus]|uniref:histidine kinase n=1 Tax=Hyphococcus flavus TaxID=1866326 RepID=A0AAE9ZA14_9PROT|nr:HAMP domain-containing sensor histidine kinase [Hyphococcus flavus]WDI30278.1 HAMP domain-containing sensor histidine kinase [Hyphococcus flavus]
MLPIKSNSGRSLSTKLLILIVLFIFFAEFVVLVPSIAKQRHDWFSMRIEEAYLASLALEGPRKEPLDEDTLRQLFSTANILGVTINNDDMRMLILAPEINPHGSPDIKQVFLEEQGPLSLIKNAWATMFSRGDRLIQATGAPRFASDQKVNIIVSQRALRNDMHAYAANILGLSLIISTLTAGLVYWALNRIIVRPVKNLTANITAFEADPESHGGILQPSDRKDELGAAEKSLAAMETSVLNLLNERRRLAALGAGISKISHDLRNILASAQLMSDRLSKSDDPSVRKLTPRLLSALDRAITLSRDTLTFGRMEPSALDKSNFSLSALVDEVLDDTAAIGIAAKNTISDELMIVADRTQLYRSLFNIARNSIEAMQPEPPNDTSTNSEEIVGELSFTAKAQEGFIQIIISDTGPGLPEHALQVLFEPFKGSRKPGGSGLGLAIASEVIRAHGGALKLKKSDNNGASFSISLPLSSA